LDPVAAGRRGADAAGREQTDEGVPAALLGADGEPLLDELPHVLEGLVHALARGVGAGPQVAAGTLLARIEPGPELLAALGALLEQEAGVIDVQPRHDAAEESVGPVVRGGVAVHLAQQLGEIVPRPLLARYLEPVALEHVEVEV